MTPEEMRYLLSYGANPLELSIAKWADIANGRGENKGADNCALCVANYDCKTCIIFETTGGGACSATPYYDYVDDPTTENAIREMKFLQSLG